MLLIAKTASAASDTTMVKRTAKPGWAIGVVLDEYSQPLPGADIWVKGKDAKYKSDPKGEFELEAAEGSTLAVSYTNHYLKEVKVRSDREMMIKLDDSYLKSPESINVLYGTSKKSAVLGSVASIFTNQLTTTPASLYSYALPGQMAGLATRQLTGFTSFSSGGLTTLSIIGLRLVNASSNNNTVSDNQEMNVNVRGQTPITIIDDVQREIASLDPESIESISVLKDGLSTMLLGINSSRPVLLITTKKGERGKTRISFKASTGIQQSLGMPTPLSAYQYAYYLNETLTSDGKPPLYTSADFNAFKNHTDPIGHPDVNWYNELLTDRAPISSYNLNVNGGNDIAKYTVSLGYFDQSGIFKTASEVPYNTNNDLSRYVLNSDVGVQVTKDLNVDLQLFGRVQTTNQPGSDYKSLLNNIFNTPNLAYPMRNNNGTFGGSVRYTNNLLAQAQYSGYSQNNLDDILANLDLNYKLDKVVKGLSAKVKSNLSYQSILSLDRSLQNVVYQPKTDGTYQVFGTPIAQNNAFNTTFTSRQSFAQFSLNYNRSFGKHNIGAIALYDSKSYTTNYDLAETVTNYAARGTYNYDEKYFAEVAINRSGDNRYPPDHQFGTFYAAGLGWELAKENFIKDNLKWINSWKIRGSYAQTGSANISSQGSLYYSYVQTYGGGPTYPVGTTYNAPSTEIANALANPFIKWEQGEKIDVGTDLSLFNNHIQFTADYYHDLYRGLLGLRGNTIALLGTSYAIENIGRNLFEGGEFTATYKNNVKNFNYFITGNFNVSASKVVYKDELMTPYPWNATTGLPVNSFINGPIYGYTALGLYQTAADAATSAHIPGYTPQPGDIKYKDLNGDGIIDQFDRSTIGNTRPLLYYGLTAGFNYKGFNASVLLQGVSNRQITTLNNAVDNMGLSFSTNNVQSYENTSGRWTPETASIATLPRLAVSGSNNNSQLSTFYVKNGNYMRIKNAELGYTLPYSVTKRLRLSGIKVFVNGENLYTFSGFKGLDPEVTPTAYPIQRVFNAGISVKL